jgi:hypothetical protein
MSLIGEKNMVSIKNPFGIMNGKLVHISEVVSGLNCNFNCPYCNAILIAKKGDEKIHHFAHHNAEECKYGLESSLHLVGKKIIAEKGFLKIPPVKVTFDSRKKDILISEAKYIKVDRVEIEKRLNNIIPDLVIYVRDVPLIIEINVTHKVNKEKLEKIKAMNISAIEVNLDKISRNITFDNLEKLLIDSVENKSWIFNTKINEKKNYILSNSTKMNFYGKTKFIQYCPLKVPEANLNICLKCEHLIQANKKERFILCSANNGKNT